MRFHSALLLLMLAVPPVAAASPLSMLYQPARSIEITAGEIVCEADSFRYRFDRITEKWEVEKRRKPHEFPPPGTGEDEYEDTRREARYRFVTAVGDDEVRLEVHRKQDGKERVLVNLDIYDHSMTVDAWYPVYEDQYRTEAAFRSGVSLDRPVITDVADDGRFLWVTLGYDEGEGYYGVGTLIRVDVLTGEVKVFQPSALATTSLSHVETAAFAVWMGTVHNGEWGTSPTSGLVRFDPVSGEVKSHLPDNSPILGRVITSLAAEGDTLWIGTDEGICRYRIRQQDWSCWRLVPGIRNLGQLPVSNRPGGQPERHIYRGNYEVRWASDDSLEVITKDYLEGWISMEPREELPVRDHYGDAHYLATGKDPYVDRRILLDEPGGSPEQAALVYRIDLERQALRTAEGWQKVRAPAGWIPRERLAIVPQLVLIEED